MRPITPKTLKALELVKQGMTPYRAAKTAGISLCTIYRHTKRLKGSEEALKGPEEPIQSQTPADVPQSTGPHMEHPDTP
jgi:transposase